jgi:hypothetical protein
MNANASIDMIAAVLLRPVALASAAMALGCAAACLAEVCWVVLGRRPAWRRSIAPRVLRRAALGMCGVTLAVAAPVAAQATISADTPGAPTVDAGHAGHACRALCPPHLDGLRLPDLPISTDLGAAKRSHPPPPVGRTVVRRGDCLWTIARELVGPRASDGRVARLVDDLYADNRPRIGPDPDLVLPGTHLSTPEVLP